MVSSDDVAGTSGPSSAPQDEGSPPIVICSTDPSAVEPKKPLEPQQTLIESTISPTRFSPLTRQVTEFVFTVI